MTLGETACWARLAEARHGVLATLHGRRGVDAVPIVFAVLGSAIVIPIDTLKAKRSTRLQRVANIEADERCVLLVEHYDDDWAQLWWVRLHARAKLCAPDAAALDALATRDERYREPGAVVATIELAPTEITGWMA
ncbi:MAG: pyridoxamine 5'-phosphate oxidase family protein [Acidimicrobiales bacterium]